MSAHPIEAYEPQQAPAPNLIAMWYAVAAWQDRQCAAQPITGCAAHLVKEAQEVEDAAGRLLRAATMEADAPVGLGGLTAEARRDLLTECADVFLLLRQVCGKAGIGQYQLACAVGAKLRENQGRTWGAPSADGSIEHVREVARDLLGVREHERLNTGADIAALMQASGAEVSRG